MQPQLKTKGEEVQHMITLTVEAMYPYVIRCFQAVFKPASVSLVFGRSSLFADRSIENTCSLDIESITEPLSEYLPEKVAIDQGVEVDIKGGIEEDFGKSGRTNHFNIDGDFANVPIQSSTETLMKSVSPSSYVDGLTQRTSDIFALEQNRENQFVKHEPNMT